MIVKGYWEVTYYKAGYTNNSKKIIKAKNAQKAVQEFYKCDNCWYQKNNYYVVSVERHSVKMIVNENE